MAALLLRENCSVRKIRDEKRRKQGDLHERAAQEQPSAFQLPISYIVSSANWSISCTESPGPSKADVSDMVWRLQRIAGLPAELLDESEFRLSKIAFVDWEPLHDLGASDKTQPTPMLEKAELTSAPSGAPAGASGGAASSSTVMEAENLLNEAGLCSLSTDQIRAYLDDFEERFGSYDDAASGVKTDVSMSTFVQVSLSDAG